VVVVCLDVVLHSQQARVYSDWIQQSICLLTSSVQQNQDGKLFLSQQFNCGFLSCVSKTK